MSGSSSRASPRSSRSTTSSSASRDQLSRAGLAGDELPGNRLVSGASPASPPHSSDSASAPIDRSRRISTMFTSLLLGVGEVDADGLVPAALFDLAALRERALVRLCGRLLDYEGEAARPKPPGRNHVSLGGKQGDVRPEVHPGEQPDDEREGAVDVAGVLHDVADVVAAEGLQKLVEEARADRSTAKLPPTHLARRQHSKSDPEETDVQRRREQHRADLPGHSEAGSDRGQPAEDRGRERATAEEEQEDERATAGSDRIRSSLEWNPPEVVHRVLGGEEDAHAGPDCSRNPEAERECTAVKRASAQLGPDHRELAEGGVHDRVVEMAVPAQDKAEHRRHDEQEGEDRKERVVGDRGGE